MRFKSNELKAAVSYINYDKPDDVMIETIMREENMVKGDLCSCLILTATWKKLPAKYDDNKAEITITKTVEVFPEEENRPPRIQTVESRDLILV